MESHSTTLQITCIDIKSTKLINVVLQKKLTFFNRSTIIIGL